MSLGHCLILPYGIVVLSRSVKILNCFVFLEHGHPIWLYEMKSPTIGVDYESDIEKVEQELQRRAV